MKKAVAYMRYSSENQDDCSIEHQRMKIKEYCKSKNIQLVDEYVDKAVTGRTNNRPGLNRLMDDIKKNPSWSMVLVFDWSRFFRNAGYAILYSNEIRDLGFELISVTQPTIQTPEGKMMEWFFHMFNEYSSNNNALHTHAGLSNKAKQGFHCGGIPPLGYDAQKDKQLTVNTKEAEAVQIIFNMFEQGYTAQRVADYLNQNGYCKKNGEPFNKNSFISILNQEKYTGTYTWNKSKQKKSDGSRNGNQQKDESEHIRIENGCPQIITKEQFERVQQIRGKKKGKSQKHYMLSSLGILKCAECGANMQGTIQNSHGKYYATYFCPNHKKKLCSMKEVRAENLDRFVALTLSKMLYHHPELKKLIGKTKSHQTVQKLKKELQGKENAIKNTLRAIEAGCTDELIKKLKKLNSEQKTLQERIKSYNYELTKENIQTICKKFKKTLIESEAPEVREFLKQVVESIIIDQEDVKININEF